MTEKSLLCKQTAYDEILESAEWLPVVSADRWLTSSSDAAAEIVQWTLSDIVLQYKNMANFQINYVFTKFQYSFH